MTEAQWLGDPWSYVPEELRIRYDEECVSIPHAVRLAAQRHPGLEALVDGDLRLTFAELEQAMLTCVRAMIAIGVRPGDRVAVWAPNSARWVLAALGAHGAGGVLVPINTRFKGEEAAYVLERSGARTLVVVTDFLDQDYLGMLAKAAPDSAVLRPGRVVVASGKAEADHLGWDEFLAAGATVPMRAAEAAIDAVTSQTLSDIMFTSGTTGHPKGVMLTHGQSLRAHGWLAKVMDFRAGDRYLIVPPFFHTFGYKAGWMACIVHGVTTLPLDVFATHRVLEAIEREKVSILLGPPTLFQEVLDSPERGRFDLSSLRVTMVSATTVPPALIRRIRDELGPDVAVSCYGLTESTSLATTTFPTVDSNDDVVTSVGRAAWQVELRVVDAAGTQVPRGAPGEAALPGLERDAGLLAGTGEDREGDRPGRLAAHRRRRRDGRARVRAHHRSPEGRRLRRRLQRLPGGGRARPVRASGTWRRSPSSGHRMSGSARSRSPSSSLRGGRATPKRSASGPVAGWPTSRCPGGWCSSSPSRVTPA